MADDPGGTTDAPVNLAHADGADFDAWVAQVQAHFAAALAVPGARLFQTDAVDLFDAFLAALPSGRQHHLCATCRRFLQRYGGLVTIDEAGRARSALWAVAGAPEFYRPAVEALRRQVEQARVVGVWLDGTPAWGSPTRGEWTHLAVTPPGPLVHQSLTQTAGQAMAEKRADFLNVQRALAEFTPAMLASACRVLDSDALYRPEKVAGPARWLRDLQTAVGRTKNAGQANVVWRAVAAAPPGYCHPRASMVGTLLVDLAAGLPFAEVARRFAAKMHPLQYQRPQAPPAAGNIARAEKLIEQLGLAPALERRFATVADVTAVWRPAPPCAEPAPGTGIFGHLRPKGKAGPTPAPLDLPPTTLTWSKFAATVLPTAEEITVYVGPSRQSFAALLSAVHVEAPPIFQWDAPDRRNPVSFYVYHEGSWPKQWSLAGDRHHPVTAIVNRPARWGQPAGSMAHHDELALFLLHGARETRTDQGNAIFPETLRADLHEVRSTIEAYSQRATIAQPPAGVDWACGLAFFAGQKPWDARVRVRSAGAWHTYHLDRWD